MRFIHILFILLLFFFSCCHRHSLVWTTLLSVEGTIIDNPDSALSVLEAIDTTYLSKGEERALYDLLLTVAKVKNDINVADALPLQSASKYFEEKQDKRRMMMANCYLGMVFYELESKSEALVNYYKAKQLAEELDDWLYAGLACRGISDIYNDCLNKKEEVEYAEQELDYFRKSQRQPYVNYALLDIARAHYNSSNHDVASRIIEELIDSCVVSHNDYLYFSAIRLKANNYITQEMFAEALPLLVEVSESGYADGVDSLRLCWTLLRLDKQEESEKLADRILNGQLPWSNFIKYRLYKFQKKWEMALTELESLDSVSERSIRKSMSNNITGSLVNYIESRNLLTQSKLKESRMKFSLIITLLIVVGIGIVVGIKKKIKQLNNDREAKVNFAKELKDALNISKEKNEILTKSIERERSEFSTLKQHLEEKKAEQEKLIRRIADEEELYREKVIQLQDNISEKTAVIGNLELEISIKKTEIESLISISQKQRAYVVSLENESIQQQRRIKLLEELESKETRSINLVWKIMSKRKARLEDFIQDLNIAKKPEVAKKKISDRITALIRELSEDKGILEELEVEINKKYDNLIKDLKEDLSTLSAKDYKLYLFSMLSLSMGSIALLLGEQTVERVYNRKRHLKDKIKQLDEEKCERYLHYIG